MTSKVTITPNYNVDTKETTLTIHRLQEGARVVVGIIGADKDWTLFVGKHGRLHIFDEENGGPIVLGDHPKER